MLENETNLEVCVEVLEPPLANIAESVNAVIFAQTVNGTAQSVCIQRVTMAQQLYLCFFDFLLQVDKTSKLWWLEGFPVMTLS